MPLINLIQEQRQVARARERKARVALISTAGIGGLCILATGALMLDATRLHMKASALEKKEKELAPLVAELETNQETIEKLQPRIDTLTQAVLESDKWNRILNHLTTNTPPETWLTSVKGFQQDRKQPMVVTFLGVSTTQDKVADLILRLQLCAELENVQLKYTQPKVTETGTQTEFEVTADVAGTKEETIEVKEKKETV
ncbi:PilN domain-containing protein [Kamptonema cortianum]|nr:PilN domain-containing protein [Geitlerinema splendidum]MDK3155298.1 PilN domain-containing protein [Kamptonema cortianum]